jgi:hypothetical protein
MMAQVYFLGLETDTLLNSRARLFLEGSLRLLSRRLQSMLKSMMMEQSQSLISLCLGKNSNLMVRTKILGRHL